MHACVVVFPGSKADRETVATLRDDCHVSADRVWHSDTSPRPAVDLVAISLGLMPHPERMGRRRLGGDDGRALRANILPL